VNAAHIRIGGEVANWPPLRAAGLPARWLWISLYISQRRSLPGLFVAGLPAIADVAKMTPDDCLLALDELIADRDLVEYDREREVLRMTEFPDRFERPANGRHIRSWWTRFRAVPDCAIRNAHIRTLEWLLDDPTHPPTQDHAKAWSETFGTVQQPVHRHRGVRRLLDNDTSTKVQPGLFQKPEELSSTPPNSIPYAIRYTDTHRSTIYDPRSDLSSSGESNGRAESLQQEQISAQRPQLGLVPLPDDLPFSISDALACIASGSDGRFAAGPIDDRLVAGLSATLIACGKASVNQDDLRLVGRWLAAGGLAYRSDLGPLWIAKPGALLEAVGQARQWRERGEPKLGGTGSRSLPAAQPAPNTAFTSGRKTL
jgi:hypothetical protein